MFCFTLFLGNANAAYHDGDNKYLRHKYWAPKDVVVEPVFRDDVLQGVTIKFRHDNLDLFKKWKIIDGSQSYTYPFVLEASLIVYEKDAVRLRSRYRLNGWDFYSESQCSAQFPVYIDSQAFDSLEFNSNADKLGIGIVDPYLLNVNEWYSFYMALFTDKDYDLSEVLFDIRFRLNIDVSRIDSIDYDPYETFKLGRESKVRYNGSLYNWQTNLTAQDIGENFAFAIVEFLDPPVGGLQPFAVYPDKFKFNASTVGVRP